MNKSAYHKYKSNKKSIKRKKYRLRKRTVKYAGGGVYHNLQEISRILHATPVTHPISTYSSLPFIQNPFIRKF